MREIKFRAWDSEKKLMFFADELKNLWSQDNEFWEGKADRPHIIAIKQAYYGKDYETTITPDNDNQLLQYTGLHDKNGVEIYEGDILKFKDHEGIGYIDGKEVSHWANIGKVYWDSGWSGNPDAQFNCTQHGSNDQPTWWKCSEKEVIGNIYENEDLLK